MTVIDAGVQPHFRYNAEIRRYLAPAYKLRSIPDVDRANLAKYLTIAKLKLENAIAVVRNADGS
jgi:hypothetical protein